MKEYNEAKKELTRVYREEKKKLAAKVQPIFFKQFGEFFEKYPEVKHIKFDISSQIYNDEDYYHGVEGIEVELEDEHMNDENEDLFAYCGWEDTCFQLKENAELFETIGDDARVRKVADAIYVIGNVIYGTDIDFLEDVFDTDKTITINKRGFTVE